MKYTKEFNKSFLFPKNNNILNIRRIIGKEFKFRRNIKRNLWLFRYSWSWNKNFKTL